MIGLTEYTLLAILLGVLLVVTTLEVQKTKELWSLDKTRSNGLKTSSTILIAGMLATLIGGVIAHLTDKRLADLLPLVFPAVTFLLWYYHFTIHSNLFSSGHLKAEIDLIYSRQIMHELKAVQARKLSYDELYTLLILKEDIITDIYATIFKASTTASLILPPEYIIKVLSPALITHDRLKKLIKQMQKDKKIEYHKPFIYLK